MECIHHWKLTSPNGPTVHGICKHCGAERDFPTTSDAVVWQDTHRRAPRLTVLERGTDTRAEVIRLVWDEPASTPG
jgi:hypothetical protein